MKNFHLSEKIENRPELREHVDRETVIKSLQNLGFLNDYETKHITILRNSRFPFQRISIPSVKFLHMELLKLYAADLEIPVIYLINSQR